MSSTDPSCSWRNISRHEETFNEVFCQRLRQTPWWLISIGFHALLVAALFTAGFESNRVQQVALLATSLSETLPDLPAEEIKPRIADELPLDREDEVIERPVLQDAKQADHDETDNDQPFEEVLGENDLGEDGPFEGPSNNPSIGVDGGGGGGPRGRGGRKNLFARGRGSRGPLDSADRGLRWLADHQDPGGFWDCDGFMKMDRVTPVCDGAGNAMYDPGVSGLALLAFLGAGETHRHGPYRKTVREGLRYLKKVQDPEGCFGPRTTEHFTYNHAIAALAMTEAYGLTLSPLFKQSAQRGIDFIHKSQNPYLAWRYGVRPQDNDTSVSGWMIMALKSAKTSGLRVDPTGFRGMRAWLDKATEPEYGRVGYTSRGTGPARLEHLMDRFPADRSESLTAVGILSRIFCGEDPGKSEMIRKGTDLCLKALPVWDPESGAIDMYYWYYASLAMFQVGGDAWKEWNPSMKSAILPQQRDDGAFDGSWDPVGPWGGEGGRVYSTALMVMCMEVYYRYPKLFGSGR